MALRLPHGSGPSSLETLLLRLPASARARLEWFPKAFREEIIRPLLSRGADELSFRSVDELALPAVRLLKELTLSIAELLRRDPSAIERVVAPGHELVPPAALSMLKQQAPRAALDLSAALGWLAEIAGALLRDYRNSLDHGFDDPQDLNLDEVEEELGGTLGNFVRGTLLAMAAVDVVSWENDWPSALESWCSVSLMELQAAANALRAQGLQIPTALRSHNPSSILRKGLLPPGVLARLVGQFSPLEVWLFGSRAVGTHGPTSDYDVFVVLDDTADLDRMTSWPRVAPFRRARLDVSTTTKSEFEQGKKVHGTLSRTVAEEGILLYERQ